MHVAAFISKLEIFEKLKPSCLSNCVWLISLILSDQITNNMYIFGIRPTSGSNIYFLEFQPQLFHNMPADPLKDLTFYPLNHQE